ncbi:hypothetical protein GCM10022222_39400 [Amycolatopsis ultiminotia]|uniref:Uncharacterized protein n=1 Tax=Amycolatopsis ultiminotia TaxID=543629 RepID=A0ABP6WP37_9PSEU
MLLLDFPVDGHEVEGGVAADLQEDEVAESRWGLEAEHFGEELRSLVGVAGRNDVVVQDRHVKFLALWMS